MKIANELLRFVVEILAIAAFGSSAAELVDGAGGIALGIGAVLVAAGYWGVLIAPKSARRLDDPARLAAEIVFFAAAALSLAATRSIWLGPALVAVAITNALLLRTHEPVLGALDAKG